MTAAWSAERDPTDAIERPQQQPVVVEIIGQLFEVAHQPDAAPQRPRDGLAGRDATARDLQLVALIDVRAIQALPQPRADAVAQFLAAHGVPSTIVYDTGLGETHPVARNDTPQGRAQNRRVEIDIVEAPA